MQPLDLGRLICKRVEDVRVPALQNDVSTTVVADDSSQPGDVLGDRHLLERAFDNLLSNALRHTSPGGEIEVGWRRVPINTAIVDGRAGSDESMAHGGPRSGHIIEAWVADTGEGIPAHVLPHIFDPLYRGEPSRSANTGGMGLGLAIAKRVVEAHGGTLTASNRAAGGARFTMRLPAR